MAPDVAVLDIRRPDGNGGELCRELRSMMPELSCLIFTSYPDPVPRGFQDVSGGGSATEDSLRLITERALELVDADHIGDPASPPSRNHRRGN